MLRRREQNPTPVVGGCHSDRHLLRMSRGRDLNSNRFLRRQQHDLATSEYETSGASPDWQQRAAKKMLDDFEASGVDEDLEHLRASWTTPFAQRPGMPRSRSTRNSAYCSTAFASESYSAHSMMLEDEDDDAPRSSLFKQGEQAKERLRTLDSLRKLAGSPNKQNESLQNSIIGGSSSSSTSPSWQQSCLMEYRSPGQGARIDFDKFETPPTETKEPGFDSWDSWSSRWAREFQKFEEMEAARQWREGEAARLEWEGEMSRRDAEAFESRHSAAKVAFQRAQKARREAEEAMHRRSEADFKQREADSRFSDAKKKQHRARGESDSSEEEAPSSRKKPQPSRHPPRVNVAATPSTASEDAQYASFGDFDTAWSRFEQQSATAQSIRYGSVPWPTSLPTVSGVAQSDSHAERKRKFRAALVRWHPDKWGAVMAKVCEGDRPRVMERVKEVTQRILEEKKRFGV